LLGAPTVARLGGHPPHSDPSVLGAPVGWFKVRYFNPNERGYDPNNKVKDDAPKVADKYLSEETTPIQIELTDPPPEGGYKIELTSK
jgi:hypothetical protein